MDGILPGSMLYQEFELSRASRLLHDYQDCSAYQSLRRDLMHLFTSVFHQLWASHNGEAHDICSCLHAQEGHVLLVKVKGRISRHMLSVLQCKHSAVASVCLVWDVCWESAVSIPALNSAMLHPMSVEPQAQGV